MAYSHADGAIARCLGSVVAGSLSITLGKGSKFAAGSPSPSSPLALGVWRGTQPYIVGDITPDGSEVLIGAVLVTGVSGDSLTVSGSPSGYASPTIQAGDWISDAPLAAHFDPSQLVGPKGEKGDKGDAGATGANGSPGSTGSAGTAATIAVGTVTTGAPGSSASVTNAGSSSAATLNFTIPAGATGSAGSAGAKGDPGVGVPAGGTTGQVLAKSSGADYATGWITPSGGGGTVPRRRTVAWSVSDVTPGTSGDAADFFYPAWACTVESVRLWCVSNPTSALKANLKINGTAILGTDLQVASGATGPVSAAGGATVYAAGAAIRATFTALPGDATRVRLEATLVESI